MQTMHTTRPSIGIRSCVLALAGLLAARCGEPDEYEPEAGAEAGPEPELGCPERERCAQPFCDQLITAGELIMGSDHGPHLDAYWPSGDERPKHLVSLDAFFIDKYEVSLERYEVCVDEGGCDPAGLLWEELVYRTVVNHYPPECDDDLALCKDRAVNAKTYRQARDYCDWVGGRLCTEAEWERAANGPGPDQRLHPWGNRAPTPQLVNLPSVGSGYVEPVDSHAAGASVEGAFNLAGNVYEWVEDAYDLYDAGLAGEVVENPTNPPSSPDDEVVARGSCFFTEPVHTVAERTVFPQDFDWG